MGIRVVSRVIRRTEEEGAHSGGKGKDRQGTVRIDGKGSGEAEAVDGTPED